MANSKIKYICVLVFSTLLGAVGQLLFKAGLAQHSMLIPYLIGGLAAYIISTGFYFFILSRVHLSWAYSLGGLSYLFTVIFANFILLENVPVLRWVGVVVIAVGVALIGLS